MQSVCTIPDFDFPTQEICPPEERLAPWHYIRHYISNPRLLAGTVGFTKFHEVYCSLGIPYRFGNMNIVDEENRDINCSNEAFWAMNTLSEHSILTETPITLIHADDNATALRCKTDEKKKPTSANDNNHRYWRLQYRTNRRGPPKIC